MSNDVLPPGELTGPQRDWLRLALVPGVGTAAFIKLLARFRTPSKVLDTSENHLAEVVSPRLAKRIAEYAPSADVDGQIRAMVQASAWLVTLDDAPYPAPLAEIYDPPLLLFGRGTLLDQDQHSVAIVGTRRATRYGLDWAERFGRGLAERGVTVVSGMAAGIDAAAHRGAIEAGGRTLAILGCGVDIVFPRENEALMERITQHGAVLSQFPMGMKPTKGNFPYRNRIISGMTQGTLIVEGPARSGALITARTASEQGRETFAIPGPLGQANSEGPNRLIQQGAKLVRCVDDILEELEFPALEEPCVDSASTAAAMEEAPMPPAASNPATPSAAPAPKPGAPAVPLSPSETTVMAHLRPDGSYIDEIAMACKLPVSEALSALTLLELKGQVRQFSGKRFAPR